MPGKIFISYARSDGEFALGLAMDLRTAGVDVWVDQIDIAPGDTWDRAVEAALHECTGLLVVLSPTAVDSRSVMDEVSFALEENKRVIPVIYRACKIPFRLRRVQFTDLTTNHEKGLSLLVRALGGTAPTTEKEQRRVTEVTSAQGHDRLGPMPAPSGKHPIFVSCASEDRPRVQPLVKALRRAGVPVWFEESDGLEAGSDYEEDIRRAIANASLFIPVLSQNALAQDQRFFRVEWREAIYQQQRLADTQIYIVPLRVGDLSPDTPEIPERFRTLKWLSWGEGDTLDAVVRYLQERYRDQMLNGSVHERHDPAENS